MQKPGSTTGSIPPTTDQNRATPTRTEQGQRADHTEQGRRAEDNEHGQHAEHKEKVKKTEEALDEGLEETFPASDPVSISPQTPSKPKT